MTNNQDWQQPLMKTLTLIAVFAATLFTAACAGTTTQQQPGTDNGDRLFLKYVEISKRPTVLNADDMVEINQLTATIKARKNACELRKLDALALVRKSVNDNYKYGIRTDDLASTHAAALQQLTSLENTGLTGCDGHGFPQGALN